MATPSCSAARRLAASRSRLASRRRKSPTRRSTCGASPATQSSARRPSPVSVQTVPRMPGRCTMRCGDAAQRNDRCRRRTARPPAAGAAARRSSRRASARTPWLRAGCRAAAWSARLRGSRPECAACSGAPAGAGARAPDRSPGRRRSRSLAARPDGDTAARAATWLGPHRKSAAQSVQPAAAHSRYGWRAAVPIRSIADCAGCLTASETAALRNRQPTTLTR